MITLFTDKNNTLSQNSYDLFINSIQFHRLACKCGHSGCLNIHGYYRRSIKTTDKKIKLRICRVKCTECGRTHAVLPSFIVPYSQVPVDVHRSVITSYESGSSVSDIVNSMITVDESNIRYIIRQYKKHWKQRLLSQDIRTSHTGLLIKSCFRFFSRQFMQIKTTPNILFPDTT